LLGCVTVWQVSGVVVVRGVLTWDARRLDDVLASIEIAIGPDEAPLSGVERLPEPCPGPE